jgi:gamma-glutamylcyclotransferase
MNSDDLASWCHTAQTEIHLRNPKVASLPGYKLAFTRHSDKRNGGVADIVRAPGETVWGVLFEVDEVSLGNIDKKEWWTGDLSKSAYKRVSVTVLIDGNPIPDVISYEVIKKGSYKPSREYLDVIIKGAEENRLPEVYVERLRKLSGE